MFTRSARKEEKNRQIFLLSSFQVNGQKKLNLLMFRQINPGLLFPFHRQVPKTLPFCWKPEKLSNSQTRRKKIVIEVYGEEKQMLEFKAALNKKKRW